MFRNVKKILKGLGATALGASTVASVALMAYAGANATISNDASKIANITAGNKEATMKVMQEYSPIAIKYSGLIDTAIEKVSGNKINAYEYFVNKACYEAYDKYKNGALEYEKNSKISKSNSSKSLEDYVSKNIDTMKEYQIKMFGDNELVKYIDKNINKEDAVKDFLKGFNGKTNNDTLNKIEKGISNGDILSYDKFKDKLSQNHTEDVKKEKYQEYVGSKAKNHEGERAFKDSLKVSYNVDTSYSLGR